MSIQITDPRLVRRLQYLARREQNVSRKKSSRMLWPSMRRSQSRSRSCWQLLTWVLQT